MTLWLTWPIIAGSPQPFEPLEKSPFMTRLVPPDDPPVPFMPPVPPDDPPVPLPLPPVPLSLPPVPLSLPPLPLSPPPAPVAPPVPPLLPPVPPVTLAQLVVCTTISGVTPEGEPATTPADRHRAGADARAGAVEHVRDHG